VGTRLPEFSLEEQGDKDGFVTMILMARNWDHLMTPFQCDMCHFRNINKRDPIKHKLEGIHLLRCIQHANPDAMWSNFLP
jgi:hypothetical protein